MTAPHPHPRGRAAAAMTERVGTDRARIEPRGLSRCEAARYVGVSASKFDELVADKRMPQPVRIDGRVLWDRFRLDDAFEALSDMADARWREPVA